LSGRFVPPSQTLRTRQEIKFHVERGGFLSRNGSEQNR
jgi:hypothetical protein